MAASGVDIVSLDWTVTIEEARRRIGNKVRVRGQTDRGRDICCLHRKPSFAP